MSVMEQVIIAAMAVIATLITRFLPFFVFSEDKETPAFVQFLGKAFPSAVFALLIVYCFRNVDFLSGLHGTPELIASGVTVALHLWKRNMFLTMMTGTALYMVLVQFVFV